MATGTQTRRILIKVDTSESKGLRALADEMGLLNKNSKSLSDNMKFLTRAFQGWLAFLGVGQLTKMSDEMQNLFNRLKITSGGVEGATKALDGLLAVANRTNQSLAGVGEIYNRLALSLGRSGATTSELQTLTENLINTFRVAGATTAETTNTIIQLSQAFSSGELRGQELRSVMEQNATLATLLRERFGSDIYKKAADGAIKVTDVLQVLAGAQKTINEQAKNLAPTFEQTLTKAMNTVTYSIGKMNEQFQLSAKFAAVVDTAMTKLVPTLILVGSVVTILALQQLPKLFASLERLSKVLLTFVVSNPFVAAFTAAGLIIISVSKNIDDFFDKFRNVWAYVVNAYATFKEFNAQFSATDFTGKLDMKKYMKEINEVTALRKRAEELGTPTYKPESAGPSAEQSAKEMESLISKISAMSKASGKLPKLRDELGALNKQLDDGVITINQYNKKLISFELYKANRQFREGKTDVFAYHEQLRDLNINELNRQLAAGLITLERFNREVSGEKLKVLTEQLEAGKISLRDYNAELTKLEDKVRPGAALYTGVASYIESVGSLSSNIAKGIEQAFGHLEDNLTEFIKTGQFNFAKFTQAILDDLTKIIVRASIVRPLAEGILGSFSGPTTGTATRAGSSYLAPPDAVNAKGGAYWNGVKKFAAGGIVDSPTLFSYGRGKTGLMGEAGSEAILPLTRTSGGDLGVKASSSPVQINIINQNNSEIETRETAGPNGDKIIEVLITSKVREGLSSGAYDKAMQQSYGIRRKGS